MAKDTKFTPGVWQVSRVDPYEDEPDWPPFCTIASKDWDISGIIPERDAHLIASAPELFEALEQLLASEDFANDRAHWESELAKGNGHAPQVLAAMNALKLARGETQ